MVRAGNLWTNEWNIDNTTKNCFHSEFIKYKGIIQMKWNLRRGNIDEGDGCWRQLWDIGDGLCRFRHQHPLSFNISVGHQHSKDVTKIEILSPTSTCHRHLRSLVILFVEFKMEKFEWFCTSFEGYIDVGDRWMLLTLCCWSFFVVGEWISILVTIF